ncbi:MAG: hypothetical protein H0X03_03275 [Nitrosopumilus sp.]|nr:hypothetical protein [Nitrosopumilus sp.]
MISDIPEEYNKIDFKIHIKNVIEGAVASKLSGYFLIDNNIFNFKAVAFGRIGGQNINIKISDIKYNQIKKMGFDPEKILILIQKKIIEGDMSFDEKNLKNRVEME